MRTMQLAKHIRLAGILATIALVQAGNSACAADDARDAQRALPRDSLTVFDRLWDDRCALVWEPVSKENPSSPRRSVRGTAWYAIGLLMRDAAGDRVRAARAIEAVLAEQIAAEGQPWDGTFFRAPEEPHPPLFAREWDDFDPNWRQFIGTAWAIALLEFSDRLPEGMAARLKTSIVRAVEGEVVQGRVEPMHDNIALMHVFLLGFAAQSCGRPEWLSVAENRAEAVHAGFMRHETFEEYNSPTYYGVDLYGLALWRKHGATPRLRDYGAAMEAALWRDIARFYHAGLRNMCGPYDRGYGMDMTHYVGLVGLWMGLVLERERAPVPVFDGEMEHAHDLGVLPLYAALGPKVPEDVLAHLRAFQGERLVERMITDQRTATAWLGREVMIGGEVTKRSRAAGTPWNQFYPATIHWRMPDGSIGWVLLKKAPRLDARAGENRLTIEAIGDLTFRVHSVAGAESGITETSWKLPGLTIAVAHDARGFVVKPGPFYTEVEYRDATRLDLRTSTPSSP